MAQAPHTTGTTVTRLLLSAAFICALSALAGAWLVSCGSNTGESGPPPFFNHEGFSKVDGRYQYTEDGVAVTKTGVDVADHQGWVDWSAVRKDGIDFAFIRIGYRGSTAGNIYQDDYFEYNLAAAHDAQIECGVYFFSQAISTEEAVEEAEFVLQTLGGAKLEYPVVFDYEMKASGINSRVSGVDTQSATAIAQAFCSTVSAAGYAVMLYGNQYDLGHYNYEDLSGYPLWFAEYGALPSFSQEYCVWQYENNGHVQGIDTPVDLNLDLSAVLESTP